MKTNRKKGFALIEVVVALILLTIYILFNTALYYNAYTNVKEVQQYTIATNLLIKTAEQVKAQSYNELTDWIDTFNTAIYTYNIAVEVIPLEYNGLEYKSVEVTISWGEAESLSVDILKYNPPIFVPVE